MFPFENDYSKYHKISEDEAKRRLSLIGGTGFCYQVPLTTLPGSLQKVKSLACAYVSGLSPDAQSPVGSGKALEVTITHRNDLKDAPKTGNLYAYCILQIGNEYSMSPPCTNLGDIPHHFSGSLPLTTPQKSTGSS